jgi:acyl-CoA reductase-like NAD-dependent aldehyde dehydrogenase
MGKILKVVSPVDDSIYVERPCHDSNSIEKVLAQALRAQKAWRALSVAERIPYIEKFITSIQKLSEQISEELTWQMGRPIKYGPNEVRGTIERATGMMKIAEASLKDIYVPEKDGFHRYIKRNPMGVIFVIPAWNYPFLIAVNSIVPGLLAGNAIVLKHSAQTPLVAERFAQAFQAADLPEGLFQFLHLDHDDTSKVIRDARVDFVAFTGSVPGGHAVQKVAAERFIGVGLELGGKDPAYVRADANLDFAIENLVDGAFYNSGQSCCGIERIYVHESVYDKFIEGCVELTKQYKLGNPLDPETNLGPMAKRSGAEIVRRHIDQAIQKGGQALIDTKLFPNIKLGENYLAPQIMVNVNHGMDVMMEETFGPVVGIMKVKTDQEALALMNDSPYGLTASIWTEDESVAVKIADGIETGTCFMNRCDYLDPYLAWTGVKDTGRGCTLSIVGYEHITRPKSYHLRIKTK